MEEHKPIVLTIISPNELPPEPGSGLLDILKRPFSFLEDSRYRYLSAFDAISCKFSYKDRVNGEAVWKPYPGAMIDAAGCARHAWEYLVFGTEDEAKEVGTKLGKLCSRHEIKVFWANAEDGVAGTNKYPRYPFPYRNLLAFVAAFRAAAPTYTKLMYNGYSWGRTSRASGSRLLHDRNVIRLFDGWSPMNYGTHPSTVEDHWRGKCFKYAGLRTPVIPTIGVGRVDKAGNVWGDWDMHKKLLVSTPVSGVNFFFGNGARDQMFKGNPRHRPLVLAAKELRAEWAS